MRNIATFLLLVALFGSSCSSTLHHIFDNKTPHEKYADKLDDTGLEDTPDGRLWLAASQKALTDAQSIQLPYSQHGYFHSDKPRALGLEFKAKQGERITFHLTKKTGSRFALYADLFKNGNSSSPLVSADTTSSQFSFDVNETGFYTLRLQPQLYQNGEYSLSVSVGPSLYFPVSGKKANVGSVWGDDRDGGKRSHEGIDIFAPKLTPVIAAADGYITGVSEGGLGGKTVWMKPTDKNIFLYYAHLDKQLVQEGQSVKTGDVLGLVGNTGNARFTPAHLHFGVYTYSGAIDPLPFVNRVIKTATTVSSKNITGYLKVVKTQKISGGGLIKANTFLVPLAVNSNGYIAELPDGQLVKLPVASVQVVKQAIKPSDALVTTPAVESKKS